MVNSFAWCLFSRFYLRLKFKEQTFHFHRANGTFQIVFFLRLCLDFVSLIYRGWVVISFDDSASRVQTRDRSFYLYRGSWHISSFLLKKCFCVSFIEIQWRWGSWCGIKRICRFDWKVSLYLPFIFSHLGSVISCL